MHLKSVAAAVTVGAAVLVGCESPVPNKLLDLSCAASADTKSERRACVDDIVSNMTLEQKVAQMIQGEIRDVTPQDVIEYGLGSVLNGGGAFPQENKYASVQDWVELADAYYLASVDTSGGGSGIPIIWGTDAVHGHNNVMGATLFPHNIGLGATCDFLYHDGEGLVYDI